MHRLDPPAEEMVGSISVTSLLPVTVLRVLSVYIPQQVYLHCHRCPCWVSCCSGLVFPGEDLVYGSRKMQRTIIGALLAGEFFCHLTSSMRVRKREVKCFCMVPSCMFSVCNRMWILDTKVYFLDQNYVFGINLVWFQLEDVGHLSNVNRMMFTYVNTSNKQSNYFC